MRNCGCWIGKAQHITTVIFSIISSTNTMYCIVSYRIMYRTCSSTLTGFFFCLLWSCAHVMLQLLHQNWHLLHFYGSNSVSIYSRLYWSSHAIMSLLSLTSLVDCSVFLWIDCARKSHYIRKSHVLYYIQRLGQVMVHRPTRYCH